MVIPRVEIPRVVIAAPASGSGKTTVATGLMAALRGRGLRVSPHKVGPDYIDPGYHALATGRPGRNLDPWLTSSDLLVPLLLNGAGSSCDIAVIEGVMGLYDGAVAGRADGAVAGHADGAVAGRDRAEGTGAGGFASTAHVAALLGAPVVLVVDAAAAGRSVAALVHGFVTWDSAVQFGGVILNRLGSDRHEEICRAAIEETGLPVLGALRRRDDLSTPSRHLGLVPAAERRADAVKAVSRLGAIVGEACDLDAIVALARSAPPLSGEPWDPHAALGSGAGSGARPVVALAGGAAFTFEYAENVELLEAAGATVVPFDPLRDEKLPEGTSGLVIGGGFPEVYVSELSRNEPLRASVAEFARAGGPIYAECAGLLYLTHELDGAPMCGVLDATATMTDRLTLGYREAVAVADSPVARIGERLRGHEFHRTAVEPGHGQAAAWRFAGGSAGQGFAVGKCVASYLHLHWSGTPRMAMRFVREASA